MDRRASGSVLTCTSYEAHATALLLDDTSTKM
jgi:hypothetical protein